MRKHRKLLISALLLAVVVAVAWYMYSRWESPPEVVRLLPESDRVAYINLKPIRLFADLSKSNPVEVDQDYRKFVDQTGIQFERDLDQVAMSWQDPLIGTDGFETDHTEARRNAGSAAIFVGRFDATRLKSYLQGISTQLESYRGLPIYSIPNEDHLVRACVLDGSRVAVSTWPSPDVMHGMIDRTHAPSSGGSVRIVVSNHPSLLETYYQKVPATSLAWVIDRVRPDSMPAGSILPFSFLDDTVVVASLRYNRSLLFRADVVAPGEAEARKVLDSANAYLLVYRSVSHSLGARGNDPDVKAALDSIQAEQKGNVTTFTATFSERFLKKIMSEVQLEGPTAPPASPAPRPPEKGHKR